MAEEANAKNTNKLIAIIAGAVLVVAAVIVAILLINKNKGEVLNDEFFKTSDKKIVLTTTTTGNNDPTVAKKVHQVYNIDGDKITSLKVYSEFESEQAAKDADAKPEAKAAKEAGQYKDYKVDGKWIIITMKDEMYQALTVEQLKMTAEALEKTIQNGVDQQTQTQTEEKTEEKAQENKTEETPAAEEATEEATEATEESEE